MTQKDVEIQALKLPLQARAELAKTLLLSLEPQEEADETVWAKEADRRFEELRQGHVSPIASDEVFREARARLK
jgi:putative addiction module component (TIGR02574 family)